MSGIAGIACGGERARVDRMLDRISHRGAAGRGVIEDKAATIGVVCSNAQKNPFDSVGAGPAVRDSAGKGRLARAVIVGTELHLVRDRLGVAPLYYCSTADGLLAFASEVKALLEISDGVREFPPGYIYDGCDFRRYDELAPKPLLTDSPETIAGELRRRLAVSVELRIAEGGQDVGAWLSGGLDSSAMTALARPHVKTLHTFAAGLPGAPDLEYARAVAEHVGAQHHEVITSLQGMLDVLPQVIRHLESFDALLVRSSITNYLVGKAASEHVSAVFSGEGGDELFAGYEYLKSLPSERLPAELLDITSRLHNTALQRVDRCSSAHGLLAHVCFLAPEVVDYALRIPVEYKLRDGVEKWILRRAMAGALPEKALSRKKAKFWEGAGVGELLAERAEALITDADFRRERNLPNGWQLNAKEELVYYRIFREHFGELADMSWMGRTKGAPIAA